MSDWLFFYPTRYYQGGVGLVALLELTIALKGEKEDRRLRDCCEEHVIWWQENKHL